MVFDPLATGAQFSQAQASNDGSAMRRERANERVVFGPVGFLGTILSTVELQKNERIR